MNEYRDIYLSLFRFLHDFSEEMHEYDLEVLNFEEFANPQNWPAHDLVGLDENRIEFRDRHRIDVFATFVVSTKDDSSLLKMNDITNLLVNRLTPTKRIPIYDGDTGAIRGYLKVVDGTRVDSPIQTDSQPARPIFVTFTSDQLTTS